ncbi:GAF domain-containing protein [Polluticoccus soli]|uniref:GAF domain-containing protein n=1 Tax=Polluticoccus soli TaxID=3034150 RepID=UPI0023E2BC94|nr:GAF domain-containing protein [Flavipsychrobacter sp. JY13-12]
MRTRHRNQFIETNDKELQRSIRSDSLLAEITAVISHNSSSIKQLSDAALACLLRQFECCYGAVLMHDTERDVLELVSELGGDTSNPRAVTIKPSETITGNVFSLGETKYLKEVPGGYAYNIKSGAGSLSASHILIIPLKFNNTTAGVVELASFSAFHEDDIAIAERLCRAMAANAINLRTTFENARLVEKLKLVQQKSAIRMEEQYASMQRLMNEIIERHKKREQELLDEIEKLKQK